jgi:hypothetical protein
MNDIDRGLNRPYGARSLSPWSIIIGLVFIVGGLSGQLALIGTNSGTALAVVGVLIVGRGIYRIRRQRAQPQVH